MFAFKKFRAHILVETRRFHRNSDRPGFGSTTIGENQISTAIRGPYSLAFIFTFIIDKKEVRKLVGIWKSFKSGADISDNLKDMLRSRLSLLEPNQMQNVIDIVVKAMDPDLFAVSLSHLSLSPLLTTFI